eukprot:12885894-Ditylum_brightwellii.AAC.1
MSSSLGSNIEGITGFFKKRNLVESQSPLSFSLSPEKEGKNAFIDSPKKTDNANAGSNSCYTQDTEDSSKRHPEKDICTNTIDNDTEKLECNSRGERKEETNFVHSNFVSTMTTTTTTTTTTTNKGKDQQISFQRPSPLLISPQKNFPSVSVSSLSSQCGSPMEYSSDDSESLIMMSPYFSSSPTTTMHPSPNNESFHTRPIPPEDLTEEEYLSWMDDDHYCSESDTRQENEQKETNKNLSRDNESKSNTYCITIENNDQVSKPVTTQNPRMTLIGEKEQSGERYRSETTSYNDNSGQNHEKNMSKNVKALCDGNRFPSPSTITTESSVTVGEDDRINSLGQSPLFIASSKCFLQGMKFLIDRGARVNIIDKSGRTCLHLAVANTRALEHLESVQLLLENGADVNHQDNEGNTPLHIALKAFCIDCVYELLQYGASREIEDSFGNNSYHIAAQQESMHLMM